MKKAPITILAIIGIIFIILFLGVAASGMGGSLPGSNLYRNKGDEGYYIFYRLLEERFFPAVFEKKYALPKDDQSTIIYIDGADDFYDTPLEKWVGRGNTLVLIGSGLDAFYEGSTIPLTEGDLILEKSLPHLTQEELDRNPIMPSAVLSQSLLKAYPSHRVIATSLEGPVIVKTRYKKGHFLFIADGELFTNNSLRSLESATLMTDLIQQETQGNIYLREKLAQPLYTPSVIKEVFVGKIAYFSFQLVLILALFMLKTGKRFSRPEILEGKKQRKFSEHIKGVGLFYQRANAYYLIEKINSEYFKTVVCKVKKPTILDEKEYEDLIKNKESISSEEIIERFENREKSHSVMKNSRS